MALAEASKRVAAEFDLTDEDVNKIVKEFIVEMSAYNQHLYTHGT
jgi:hypothetical protein